MLEHGKQQQKADTGAPGKCEKEIAHIIVFHDENSQHAVKYAGDSRISVHVSIELSCFRAKQLLQLIGHQGKVST